MNQAAAFVAYFAGAENMAKLNQADALIPASTKAREAILQSTGGKDGWDMTMKSAAGLTGAPFLTVDAYTQWKDTIPRKKLPEVPGQPDRRRWAHQGADRGVHPGQPLSIRGGWPDPGHPPDPPS